MAKEEMEVGRLGTVGEAALPVSPPQLCLQLLASLTVLADVFPLFSHLGAKTHAVLFPRS